MSNLVYEINDPSPAVKLNTSKLFDVTHASSRLSAIDIFFEKARTLNTILPQESDFSGPLPSLVLLGYVSAVESYFRDIIRRIILIDPSSRACCEKKTLTYGAALSHDREKLPEALLENHSFAGDSKILNAFKQFVGIQGSFPDDVKVTLAEFSKVCQLRHCVVHRFGYLGSNNAIHLGLRDHEKCLEKPLSLDFDSMQGIFLVCTNAVRTTNSFLFHKILRRRINTGAWSWNFETDRKVFEEYFSAFVSSSPIRTPRAAYDELEAHFKTS